MLSGAGAGVALGLATALCAGVGSFAGQRLVGRVGWSRAAWSAQCAALVPVTLVALLWSGAPAWRVEVWHALGLGALNVVSVVALYRAFAVGSLAIVGPISSAYAAVTVGLTIAAGEPPSLGLGLGMAAVIAGVAIASASRGAAAEDGRRARAAGVAWAVLASMSLGTVLFLLEPVSAALGPVWPVACMRVSGVVLLGLLRARGPAAGARLPAGLVAACVLLDTGGLVLYAIGSLSAGAALVAVLGSLAAVVTVLLARWRLRERLSPLQWLGVVLVLAGTTWISHLAHRG